MLEGLFLFETKKKKLEGIENDGVVFQLGGWTETINYWESHVRSTWTLYKTRWWQLKHFWNFHPENMGNDSHFD